MNLKSISLLFPLAALILILAGCGGTLQPTPAPTPDMEATVEARIKDKQAEDAAPEAKSQAVPKAMVEAAAQAAPTASPVLPTPTSRPTPAGIRIKGQEVDHVDLGEEHPNYNSVPGTSGWHFGAPQAPARWGIHGIPLPDEVLIHNLEHGYVNVHYNCPNGCVELVDQLSEIVNLATSRGGKVLMSPFPDMDSKIALTAWTFLDKFEVFDEVRVTAFINSHESSPISPEATVPRDMCPQYPQGNSPQPGLSIENASPLHVDATASAHLPAWSCRHFFSFQAEADQTYVISTQLFSMEDSELRLFDKDATTELAYNDNDNARNRESKIVWTAREGGTYYVAVGTLDSYGGTYEISIAVATPTPTGLNHFEEGHRHLSSENYTEAIKSFTRYILLNPNDAQAF